MQKVFVKNIEYNPHADSLWTIDVPGINISLVCSDLAMTKETHLSLIGKECELNLCLELGYGKLIKTSSKDIQINDRDENISDGYSVVVTGRVSDILDEDEFLVDSTVPIKIELEESLDLTIGDYIEVKGLMRLEPPDCGGVT